MRTICAAMTLSAETPDGRSAVLLRIDEPLMSPRVAFRCGRSGKQAVPGASG